MEVGLPVLRFNLHTAGASFDPQIRYLTLPRAGRVGGVGGKGFENIVLSGIYVKGTSWEVKI
jgi:hypothetical protein